MSRKPPSSNKFQFAHFSSKRKETQKEEENESESKNVKMCGRRRRGRKRKKARNKNRTENTKRERKKDIEETRERIPAFCQSAFHGSHYHYKGRNITYYTLPLDRNKNRNRRSKCSRRLEVWYGSSSRFLQFLQRGSGGILTKYSR